MGWLRRKPVSQRRQGLALVFVTLFGIGVLYDTFVGQPRAERQVKVFEGVFARLGVLEGARFESMSGMSKGQVALVMRCYTSERGVEVIDDYYDRALQADGWTRDVAAEQQRHGEGDGFDPRVYAKGEDVATLQVTGQQPPRRWRYCLTLSHWY